MNKVFISYAHANADFAIRLARDLQEAGLDIWMDREGLESGIAPGSGWAKSIDQALKDCGAAVGIYSPESMQSNAKAEWSRLIALGKPFFPVRHRHCDIPWELAPIQYIDFVDEYDKPLSDLLEVLRDALRPPHVFLNIAEDDRRWLDKFRHDLAALVSYELDRTLRFAASPSPSPAEAPLFIPVMSRAWLASETAQMEVAKFQMRVAPESSRLRELRVLREPLPDTGGESPETSAPDALAGVEIIQFFFDLDDPKSKTELLPVARQVSERLRALLEEHGAAAPDPESEPERRAAARPHEGPPADAESSSVRAEPTADAAPKPAPEQPSPSAAAPATGEAPTPGGNGRQITSRGTVFLARVGPQVQDIAGDANAVRRELERQGYRVLPEGDPPTDRTLAESQTRAALESADLAIHLLGAEYGAAFEGDWRSVGELQLELSAEIGGADAASAGAGRLRRLVWISSEAGEPEDPRQQKLHEKVQQSGAETEWFKDQPLEAFKSVVHQRLEALEREKEKKEAAAGSPVAAGTAVYLMYQPADQEIALRLYKELQGRRLRVWTPLFDGTPEEIDENEEKYLRACDAGVVIYGQAREAWWKDKLLRVSEWGRQKPLCHYFDEPRNLDKEAFDDPDAMEIRAWEDPALTPFLERLGDVSGGE